MAKIPLDEMKRREDEAWLMVLARETGKVYFSEAKIKTITKISVSRVREMVGRCRAMRKSLGFDVMLPEEWGTARLMPLPPNGSVKQT